jgi:hypothetical protein
LVVDPPLLPMPAPRVLRCAAAPLLGCALLSWVAAPLAAKPILPHGPHGSTIATAQVLRVPSADPDGMLGDASGPALFATAPNPLPPNVAGVNFEATGTAEFGDLIRFSGTAHFIGSVSVTMSTTALQSETPGATAFGFTHPITLSLYAVDRSAATPRPGAVLARVTESFLIPWRPEPDATAQGLPGRPWRAVDGHLYTGRAFTLTFDVGALGLALPDEVVVGVSFNTQHAGPQPVGVPGPYDGLAIAVTDQPSSVGIDPDPDAVFWKTNRANEYSDGGVGGSNVLRADSGWTPYKPAIRIGDSNFGGLYATFTQIDGMRSSDREIRAALNAARSLGSEALDRELWEGNQRLDPAFGGYVFEFLAEAGEALHYVVTRHDPHETEAQQAIDGLLQSSATLSETMIVYALILGGNARRIIRAQRASDAADAQESNHDVGGAIDRRAEAWREALESLR